MSGKQVREPMHYGEVFGIWTYVLHAKNVVSQYQIFLNHAGDQDFSHLLQTSIHHIQGEIRSLEDMLKDAGAPLSPTPSERPSTDWKQIPPGARWEDPQMAALVLKDIIEGLVACSVMVGQSVREDISDFFTALHRDKSQFKAKYLKLMKDKGWYVSPPLHNA